MGLKGVETFANGEDIVEIQDITDFVDSQYPAVKSKAYDILVTPKEEVYHLQDDEIIRKLDISTWDPSANNNNNNYDSDENTESATNQSGDNKEEEE